VTTARILVIDDEEQIRRFLRISLKSQGYQVIEADNAEAGLAWPRPRPRTWSSSTSGFRMRTARRSGRDPRLVVGPGPRPLGA
jgi:DNA-binding NtrC family response regulator